MAVTKIVFLLLLLAYNSYAFLLNREVIKRLRVNGARAWGTWGLVEFCPKGYYAAGYDMKIETYQWVGDDTSLNAVSLRCVDLSGRILGGTISSKEGIWGNWVGVVKCPQTNGQATFLTQFALQNEGYHRNDNTAANYIKFQCRDIGGRFPSSELSTPPGHGHWGTWSPWSASCPLNSAICGIQTLVEDPQGREDDTALNDVELVCCALD